ncbi:DNA polymerase III, alpha subunit [Thermoanaerobacterium thermosaccharolyticum DSM 571]|uniref:DNA polymerase III PolC-type n=1 Tax=Thermoanaerobacterium thermosaccharolyticum (strain ATCC 7956 / DSM 571 / NCIMB 9385 / NCA 3814 / NCTC 13789 / WDCM 00135 / 2032) TaxID=580327 RepID=D9TM62_THETC|nr:PolC-type DNA polymerase III [Thermoanaerobacterium thermosaccharolyticum]ADL68928.1 DNA polymerase III, alpha subunit [Thermoanaerobacterium thermosaccharolyticum DSM 571]
MLPSFFKDDLGINDVEINKISLSLKEKKLILYLPFNLEKEITKLENLKSTIKSKIPQLQNIEFKFKGSDINDISSIISDHWEDIVKKASEKYPGTLSFIKSCDICIEDNQQVLIKASNEVAYNFLKKNKINIYICELIKKYYGLNVELILGFDESLNSKVNKKIQKDEEMIVNNIITTPTEDTQKAASDVNNDDKKVLLGKEINSKVIKISEISQEGDDVTIQGEIFALELREIKSKYLTTFDITDNTSSFSVKAFFSDEKYNAIKDKLKVGSCVKVRGTVIYDKYERDLIINAKDIEVAEKIMRIDNSPEKRVELHVHTQMSSMDGVSSAESLIKRASEWGHKAIAITDHAVLQAYPEAQSAAKKYGVKVIYGVEGYLVNDGVPIVSGNASGTIDDSFVVFDIETTGLSSINDSIIEIGAVKIKDCQIVDTFETFVNPQIHISNFITKLTGITDDMVKRYPPIDEVLPKFLEFIKGSTLVAHNANFDVTFIKTKAKNLGIEVDNPVLDTLELSRHMYENLKNYKLDTVAQHLGVSLENHHRAVDDARATAEIFLKSINKLKENGIEKVNEINSYLKNKVDIKKMPTYHVIILVKNQKGLRNLYELVSKSNLEYFHRNPRIPKSLLTQMREGLLIGSACEQGEVFRGLISNFDDDKLQEIIRYYDYLEIQPLGNNEFLIDKGEVNSKEELIKINKRIYELGKRFKKPVVATCDVHFLDPWDDVYRKILMYGKGFKDADRQPPLYFRTTEEMLSEFNYFDEKTAKEIVIDNPNKIVELIEDVKPIPDGTFPPSIEGAEEELRKLTLNKAHEIYGEKLPEIVEKRLDKELNSIINNGYAVMYIIAQKLVTKSLNDGYLVGSRGSVGSSFVATMSGITEVNPLPPHYICPQCKYSEFALDGSYGSGVDMPDKNCPNCGTKMKKDGHDIPFEVFLGFEGDKEPDIDLNFSGDYQPIAHKYTEEIFGTGHVFRAGTIGTLADKTAYGFVKKYFEEKNLLVHNAEIKRLVMGCTGAKRTTGQHPGGVMVVPKDRDIYEFTPIQHPADAQDSDIITTHFDYHSISGRLLKLDILGHDDPTVIRMLEDLTGVNAREIPLDDKETMSLFTSVDALNIKPEDINCTVGTLGLPEFGTRFVRQMLVDTKPTTFAELVRISGLSHGTDVWLNNAQDIIKEGKATLKEVISTRDDIMLFLISKGMDKKLSFKIMESVRKGKGIKDEEIEEMKKHDVPDWFIQSCKKIKYMFPKAHAVAYVIMAFRIAYFKVHYPEAFYATYFTVRADEFNLDIMNSIEKIKENIRLIESKGNNATAKEKGLLTILEVGLEMYLRGLKFTDVDLYKSDAIKFLITKDGILPPLNSLEGIGKQAAKIIAEERKNGKFLSIEDLRNRTRISKTVIDILKQHRCLQDVPESNQLSLF